MDFLKGSFEGSFEDPLRKSIFFKLSNFSLFLFFDLPLDNKERFKMTTKELQDKFESFVWDRSWRAMPVGGRYVGHVQV